MPSSYFRYVARARIMWQSNLKVHSTKFHYPHSHYNTKPFSNPFTLDMFGSKHQLGVKVQKKHTLKLHALQFTHINVDMVSATVWSCLPEGPTGSLCWSLHYRGGSTWILQCEVTNSWNRGDPNANKGHQIRWLLNGVTACHVCIWEREREILCPCTLPTRLYVCAVRRGLLKQPQFSI